MVFPKEHFCLQGQSWCHWNRGEQRRDGSARLGMLFLPPRQALGSDSSAGQALVVQGTEHLRAKQSWGCSGLKRDFRKIISEGTMNWSHCAKKIQWDVKVWDSLEGSLSPKDKVQALH